MTQWLGPLGAQAAWAEPLAGGQIKPGPAERAAIEMGIAAEAAGVRTAAGIVGKGAGWGRMGLQDGRSNYQLQPLDGKWAAEYQAGTWQEAHE